MIHFCALLWFDHKSSTDCSIGNLFSRIEAPWYHIISWYFYASIVLRHEAIMLQKLSIMLFEHVLQKSPTYYAFKKMPIMLKTCHSAAAKLNISSQLCTF